MDDQGRPRLDNNGRQGEGASKVQSGTQRSVPNRVSLRSDPKQPDEGPDSPTSVPLSSSEIRRRAAPPPSTDSSDAPTLLDGTSPAPPVRRATSGGQEFQASQPVLKEGTVLVGRYEILKTLGEGGMGAVYKAKDLALNRTVALKVIRPELANNPSIIDRFKQELLLSQRVTHRNVIRIYDLGEGDGMQFITMEFIEGRDLRSIILERKKLSPEEAVGIMEQICLALDSAHSVGVIHRDLKPQNIMIDGNGRVLVMDFGLARTVEGEGMTQTGALVGTMEYMSPEQALAQELDQRSDLFSAGLIFYEMLTGEMPFRADSALASLIRRTQERASPISSHDASFPQNLIFIVSKCLEREPAARYQTAKELLADLEAWDGKRTAGAVAFQSVQPWGQDIPWSKIGVGAVVIILAVLGFLLRYRLSAPVTHGAVSVLVADFQNKTSDSLFDGTLEPGFNLALEGASFITAYSRSDAHKAAEEVKPGTHEMDESLARLVAQREGVSVVVSGVIGKDSKGYRISAKAVDTISGKTLAEEATSVQNKDEVLQSIGTLAAGIRKKLGDVTPESAQLLQTATYSSSSLEATHEYVQGQQMQNSGKWEEAISHYQRALQLDPNMARAYAATGAAKFNLGRMDEAEQNYQQAMSHIDRMSDREKYRTRAEYFLVKHEPGKAIEEYNKLVQQFPGDTSVHTNLSFAYFLLRNMPMALEEARKSMEYSGKSSLERNNLAIASMYAGDFASAEKEARTVMQQDPSYLSPYSTMAAAQIGQGRVDEAKQTYEKQAGISARGSSLAKLGLADLALFQGRADEAIPVLRSGIEDDLKNKDPGAGAAKSIALAQAELLAGQRAAALSAADKAVSLDKGPPVLHAAGGIYAQVDEFKKADALMAQLKASIDPDPQLYAKLLEAEIALNRKDVKTAVSALKEAQNLADSWLGHLLLGRAYLEAGAFPEADSEIETCIKRKGEASAVYLDEAPTFRLFPPVYYYLGRVQEGLKSPAYADSYKTLLSIQEKGTGPLLSDARRRVAKP